MKLILMGCEYSGTTTLSRVINEWIENVMGQGIRVIHDHWKIPNTSGHEPTDASHFLTEEEQEQVLALSPKLKEMTQRHSLYYHMPTPSQGVSRIDGENSLTIGYHFDDSIYGPLYFGYGRPIDPEDRSVVSRFVEHGLLLNAPETVLVLVKASSDVIRKRMREQPHHRGVLQEPDIEYVIERFDDEFKRSLLSRKITLDTTDKTPEETLDDFIEKVEWYLTEADRSRIMLHRTGLKPD